MVLQPLSAADSARLWALDQRCFPPGIAYSESEIRACLLQAARGFHAAIGATMDDGGDAPQLRPPAAFILSLLHRRRGHIITLDVAPEHRRRGLGWALMLAAEAHFRALGAVGMRLETAVDNQAARRFYARLGYREMRELPDYYARGQHGLLLLKSLAAVQRVDDPPRE
ncbi:MAG TPA: N-acetyltransferase [Terriglobales bacterium]